jgi:hypothetical protein
MGRLKYFIVVIFFLLLSCNNNTPTEPEITLPGKLVINEFLASNNKTNADEYDEFDDWIELYNGTYESINVGGMYISDDLLNKIKFKIPDTDSIITTIHSNSYLLIWADNDTDQGILHVGFKLSGAGEEIILTDKDSVTTIDFLTFSEQQTDFSMGRETDGAESWLQFANPTPGKRNN